MFSAFRKTQAQPDESGPHRITPSTEPLGPATNDPSSRAQIAQVEEQIRQNANWVAPLREQLGRVVVGQQALVDRLMVALLSGGHVLVEGLPGLAKTLALKTLASATDAHFSRVQFTPDMLPADIVGTLVYQPHDGAFVAKPGPIFANFVLADEINRAPAKVQSALLEAMQERQVTLGDTTHMLPRPFLVMATQNPIEQEGTYALPEAQLDRFMMKVDVGYPSLTEERAILDRMATSTPRLEVDSVVSVHELARARSVVDGIYVDGRIRDYIVRLVAATRDPGDELSRFIRCGASPRATIALTMASKAYAFVQGRGYVTPQDAKLLAPDVLRHRIARTYEADAERMNADALVAALVDQQPIP